MNMRTIAFTLHQLERRIHRIDIKMVRGRVLFPKSSNFFYNRVVHQIRHE